MATILSGNNDGFILIIIFKLILCNYTMQGDMLQCLKIPLYRTNNHADTDDMLHGPTCTHNFFSLSDGWLAILMLFFPHSQQQQSQMLNY